MLFGAGAGLMNVPLTNAVMQTVPQSRAGVASALLNASREVAGLLGVTVIGAVLSTRQSAALRSGTDPVHAFVDGYHLGLWVTIVLLAAGVAVSYLTLRPRAAALARTGQASSDQPGAGIAPSGSAGATRESVAVAELTTVDELAADLLARDEITR
jgi:hypothetical protein